MTNITDLITRLEALKYKPEQGMDYEMFHFNEGVDAAIKSIQEIDNGTE